MQKPGQLRPGQRSDRPGPCRQEPPTRQAAVHAARTRPPRPIEAALAGEDVVIARKIRLNKWPEMVAFLDRLPALLRSQGGAVAACGPSICLEAGLTEWPRRDPFDRLLAAAARQGHQVLVSAGVVFDGVATRMW